MGESLTARYPRSMRMLLTIALSLASACATAPRAKMAVSSALLDEKPEEPALFLGPEQDAPAFGYAHEAVVTVLGPVQGNRVPVRIEGPLQVEACVATNRLSTRVQRRGRLRGTPVYLGPGDRVVVIGSDASAGRVRARAVPTLQGRSLGTYEGSYPAVGLSGTEPKADALAPDPGTPYILERGTALPLYEAPGGKLTTTFNPQPTDTQVTVLAEEGGYYAVRLGDGPYLIGYTQAKLKKADANQVQAKEARPPRDPAMLPVRLASEPGPVKRVSAGTKMTFNDRVIAVFQREGWARVIAQYPGGQVDVLAAVGDDVTVRGLVPLSSLSDPNAKKATAPAQSN